MAYRSSRGSFVNPRGGNRGNSYNSNYSSSRGNRGGSSYNDNFRNRGGSSYRGSRGTNRGSGGSWSSNSPSTGGYNSMNRNSGSNNWSSQGDSNYDSRNRYSGNNERYSSGHNDEYRRYKEGGRSHRDSDMGGYSSSGDDFGRYSGGGGGSYVEDRSSRSSYAPDNNYGGSSSYRGRESSRDYGSDFRKPLPPDDDRSSPPSPRYSGPSNRGRGTRGYRVAERPGMRGRSSASVSYRGSYGGSAGLIKRKRLEPTSNWRTHPIRKGYDIANRRIHTVKRTSMRDHDDYRARKIAEFREKTRQLRERVRSPSVDEEEIEEEVEEEVEEEESANDDDGDRPEDNEMKKEESPKKKRKILKKVVKIVKKKVKKPKLNGDVSKSSYGDKTSPRKTDNNLLDSRGEPFIKLLCPHCEVTCKTFREYEIHLLKIRHRTAMSQLARKRKHELFMFRQDQRKEQKEIDDKATEEDPKTEINYCKLCQLNFKQPKSDHFSSTLHKKIKQFLQPACNVCHLMFASPMRYEHHLCSTNHLKKVDIYDRRTKRMAAVPSADEADGDVDMDNFMVLDSVGSGDDEGSEEGDTQDNNDDGEKKKKSKSKKEISLGKEFCKKVEVYYCELCKFNLPPHDDVEQQLSLHCRNRVHLQRYVQHCEKNKSREKAAEVISKENAEETKSDSDSSVNKGVENEDKNDASDNGDDESSANVPQDEETKNDFDWTALDNVIAGNGENSDDK